MGIIPDSSLTQIPHIQSTTFQAVYLIGMATISFQIGIISNKHYCSIFFSLLLDVDLQCINHTALRMIFLDKNLILVCLCLKHLGFPLIPRQKDSKLLNIVTCHMLLNALTPVVWLNPMSRLSYPF